MLQQATGSVALSLLLGRAALTAANNAKGPDAELNPQDAFKGVFDAMDRFPLVALGEHHLLQEFHDFITALLFHPAFAGKINDIVVEFGNARHQKLADRFVLDNQPVANRELEQIWRHTIGGGVLWDAPVYAQFFRNVRALNWMRPREHRLRVLLGDPRFDHARVQTPADKLYVLSVARERDRHFADLVEREVLAKGRRAMLLAGTGHVLRGIRVQGQPNAATLLSNAHPGQLFVIVPIIENARTVGKDTRPARVQAIARRPRPSLAVLAGTWLGATPHAAERAIDHDTARFSAQADALLFLGPAEALTASRPDPSLYQTGPYAAELKRLQTLATKLNLHVNLNGMAIANAGPGFFQ
jgi:hypothetical protein